MLDFEVVTEGDRKFLETSISGKPLLFTPQLNKGTAFTTEERIEFNLLGKLPPRIETLDEQVARAYQQFLAYETNLQRNIYLNNLHDKNQVLFYKLVSQYIGEMMPMIYTPIVGTAVKKFSKEFRQPRGLYISYPDEAHIDLILGNRSNPDINLIVVTDGEGVLGIGDQGVGGMDIPVAKLMVYSLCGGIDPCKTLPICLDVGTNNQELLDESFYLGWKHKRVEGKAYDDYIEAFIKSVKKHFPGIFLHWEDFGRSNASKILSKYQDQICTFNDDIQGTGAVALAAILAGVSSKNESLEEQRYLVFGAGTAGMGISDQICHTLVNHCGMSEKKARALFWLVDRNGLILNNHEDLTPRQTDYARDPKEFAKYKGKKIGLLETVKHIKPTVLIGCSARGGAFNQSVIEAMTAHVDTPIILPLSNPTECAEAKPADIIEWTDGKVLLATGSPFDPVEHGTRTIRIAQCNNALAFPGIGLGINAVKAARLNDNMMWVATEALSKLSPVLDMSREQPAPLLPSITKAQDVAKAVAIAVARQAYDDGLTDFKEAPDFEKLIDELFWIPRYLPFRRR